MENRFCLKCGSKMKLIPREGLLYYINFEGEECRYKARFNRKTGKPIRLYACPNFSDGVEKNWLRGKVYKDNGHDRYSEDDE